MILELQLILYIICHIKLPCGSIFLLVCYFFWTDVSFVSGKSSRIFKYAVYKSNLIGKIPNLLGQTSWTRFEHWIIYVWVSIVICHFVYLRKSKIKYLNRSLCKCLSYIARLIVLQWKLSLVFLNSQNSFLNNLV